MVVQAKAARITVFIDQSQRRSARVEKTGIKLTVAVAVGFVVLRTTSKLWSLTRKAP